MPQADPIVRDPMRSPRAGRPYGWLPLLITVMTAVALVVGAIAFSYIEARLVAATGESLALAATEIADKLDRILHERYSDIQIMAQTAALKQRDRAAMSRYLSALREAYPIYFSIGITDAKGRVVAATDATSVGEDRSGEPWFRIVRERRGVHLRDVEHSIPSGEVAAVLFAAPMQDPEGRFQGAVITRVELPVLEDVLARTVRAFEAQRGASGKLEWQLMTRDGEVIADSILRQEGKVNLKKAGLPSALLSASGRSGYVEEQHRRRQVPVVTGYARTEGYGDFPGFQWGILVRMDRSEILAPIHAFLLKLGVAGAIVFVPMLGVLLWSTGRLRKEREQAQKERTRATAAEIQFRGLLEFAPDAIVITRADGRMALANRQAKELFGYTQSELQGQSVEVLLPERFREAHVGHRENYHTDPRARPMGVGRHLVGRRRDGTEFPVEISLSPLETEKDRLVMAAIRDITDRERAERRQAAQLAISRVLAESGMLGEAAPRLLQAVCDTMGYDLGEIWLVDREAGVLRCETIWHAPEVRAEEFVDRSLQMTFSPGVGLPGRVWSSGEPAWIPDVVKDANFPRAPMAAQSRLHGAFGFPIRSGGETLGVFEFFSREIREPDKELLLMMADIGIKIGQFVERKRVEESARASEERFRLAIDHAHDAIFFLDGSEQILWANRRAEALTGASMEDLVGRPLMAAFSSQPMAKSKLAALGRGKPVPPLLEFEVFRAGGSAWMEVNVTNVEKGAEVVGRILVARDITERKQAEQQLRQAEKLAALGTLLDGVAHELNNPLFMISGYTQMASERVEQGRYEDLARDLASIREATQRATEIVQRALGATRSATGRSEPCDVNALLEQTLKLVGNDLTIHQIQARTDFHADLPAILADPQELVQVLLALITNAREAMATAHARGTLTVTTALVSTESGPWVEVRVADDGPGIAPEQQSRVFEPFAAAKQGSKGTGLGLPIAHRIVTELRGTLTCESKVEQGATFIIRLPVMPAAA